MVEVCSSSSLDSIWVHLHRAIYQMRSSSAHYEACPRCVVVPYYCSAFHFLNPNGLEHNPVQTLNVCFKMDRIIQDYIEEKGKGKGNLEGLG